MIDKQKSDDSLSQEAVQQIWTCAMHPQIRMNKAGKCPICAMDLILLQQVTSSLDEDAIRMTEAALKLADIETTIIGKQNAEKSLSLYGKVQADERQIKIQAAHFPGRIEKLMINFTGEMITKGAVIARIYSPALTTAQDELLQAKQMKPAQYELIEAARAKLRQWKLTDAQIAFIEQSGKTRMIFDIISNVSGVVISKNVNQGDYVQEGETLFEVADLSRVWVLFDAYESDLPWIKMGNNVSFTLESLPGRKFNGKVTFIDPIINSATRVALVRVETSNPGAILKPEMFANGTITSSLPKYNDGIIIPQSAVLWTGSRSVVYVKIPNSDEPTFKMREIELGPALSNSYVVLSGLNNGEEIVTNGAFSIDASVQLAGKPSMMNPKSDKSSAEVTSSTEMKNDSKMSSIKNISFKVSGNCDMCKGRIETAAKSITGVKSAEWVAAKQLIKLTIDPSKTNSFAIQKAIAIVGHDTEKYKAKNEVYNKLPKCCLYRK